MFRHNDLICYNQHDLRELVESDFRWALPGRVWEKDPKPEWEVLGDLEEEAKRKPLIPIVLAYAIGIRGEIQYIYLRVRRSKLQSPDMIEFERFLFHALFGAGAKTRYLKRDERADLVTRILFDEIQ